MATQPGRRLTPRGPPEPHPIRHNHTATPTVTTILWLLLPLLLVVGVLLWLSESREQRIRRWRAAGMTQRAIAERLGISTYAVRKVLA